MSRFVEVMMRIMVIVDSVAACVIHFGGDKQEAAYMWVLAIFSLLVAMDLERGRYDSGDR